VDAQSVSTLELETPRREAFCTEECVGAGGVVVVEEKNVHACATSPALGAPGAILLIAAGLSARMT
jgi:hypothetical protein